MPSQKDYYEVLGIAKSASKDEIKSGYRKLAMQFHPDRNPGDKAAEEKFKEVTHAYQILIDENKRAAYDRYGFEGVNSSAGFGEGFGGFSDVFSDIFEDFFGMGPRRAQKPSRGSDLGTDVEITFMEAAFGVEKEINVRRDESCRKCRGDGAEPGTTRSPCKQCRGTGQVSVSSGFFSITRTCSACRGQGSVIQKPCTVCKGAGRESVTKKMKVNVPAGIDNGTRIRIPGEGESGHRGGTSGDLYIDVFVEPHPIFKRHGTDVLCEVPISFVQAGLGAEIEIPTLRGEDKLKIPAGTQTGKVFVVKGQGVASLQRNHAVGDLHVRVVIETPTGLSAKQKDLLKEFASLSGEKVNPIAHSFMQKVKELFKS